MHRLTKSHKQALIQHDITHLLFFTPLCITHTHTSVSHTHIHTHVLFQCHSSAYRRRLPSIGATKARASGCAFFSYLTHTHTITQSRIQTCFSILTHPHTGEGSLQMAPPRPGHLDVPFSLTSHTHNHTITHTNMLLHSHSSAYRRRLPSIGATKARASGSAFFLLPHTHTHTITQSRIQTYFSILTHPHTGEGSLQSAPPRPGHLDSPCSFHLTHTHMRTRTYTHKHTHIYTHMHTRTHPHRPIRLSHVCTHAGSGSL